MLLLWLERLATLGLPRALAISSLAQVLEATVDGSFFVELILDFDGSGDGFVRSGFDEGDPAVSAPLSSRRRYEPASLGL